MKIHINILVDLCWFHVFLFKKKKMEVDFIRLHWNFKIEELVPR